MDKPITEYRLGALLDMRVEAMQGKRTRFTVKEINDESDRRRRLNTPIAELMDVSIAS